MEFSLAHSFEELAPLAPAWNLLASASSTCTPFQRFEYLQAWWQGRGGGEWSQAELALVLARRGTELAGVAPLFFSRNREQQPALMLLGSIEISDFLDLIVPAADLPAFLPGLFDFLSRSDPALSQPWACLDWHNLFDTSPTLPIFQSETLRRGWQFSQQTTYRAPRIPLPGDFETYLASIDKKQRHEIRRKMRRLAEDPRAVRWYIVDDAARLDSELNAFLELMAADPAKAAFLTPAMRLQMTTIARAAFSAGWLQLAFMEVDGEKAAGYLDFDYNDRIWVYNSGLDRRFMDLSPGWVLLAHLLQWANEHQRVEFDFMRGEEDYKYRFGGFDRHLVRLTALRP